MQRESIDKSKETAQLYSGGRPKCYFFESRKCMRDNCQFRHPSTVCEKYKQDKCELGIQCRMKHEEQNRRKKQKEDRTKELELACMEQLIEALKEGFKSQNEVLVRTVQNRQ